MLNQPDDLDRVFRALSDASRRAVVRELSKAPKSVSALAKPLNMSLPSVLQHLQVLEDCGLITSEKTGRVRTCHLAPAALSQAERWIVHQRKSLEQRLDRLGTFLAKNRR